MAFFKAMDIEGRISPPPMIPDEWREVFSLPSGPRRARAIFEILSAALKSNRWMWPFELDALTRLLGVPGFDHGFRPGRVVPEVNPIIVSWLDASAKTLKAAAYTANHQSAGRPRDVRIQLAVREHEFNVAHWDALRSQGWSNVPSDLASLDATIERWWPEDAKHAGRLQKRRAAMKAALKRYRRDPSRRK